MKKRDIFSMVYNFHKMLYIVCVSKTDTCVRRLGAKGRVGVTNTCTALNPYTACFITCQ